MSDMISREEIVDILAKMKFFQGQRAGRELWSDKPFEAQEQDLESFNKGIETIRKYILQLEEQSSVEPVRGECFNCSRRSWYQRGYGDAMLNMNKWIPCSERLPECEWGYETKELMYQLKNTGSIEIGYYGEGGHYRDRYFRTYRDSYEGVDASEVIAWMPLPEPFDMRKKVE